MENGIDRYEAESIAKEAARDARYDAIKEAQTLVDAEERNRRDSERDIRETLAELTRRVHQLETILPGMVGCTGAIVPGKGFQHDGDTCPIHEAETVEVSDDATETPFLAIGQVYVDDSHTESDGGFFTIHELPTDDERVVEIGSGQWYELDGPEGLLEKLRTGIVRMIGAEPTIDAYVIVHPTAHGDLPNPGADYRTYDQLDGETARVVRELGDDERDAEVGRMYTVRFSDGTELDTFADELEIAKPEA